MNQQRRKERSSPPAEPAAALPRAGNHPSSSISTLALWLAVGLIVGWLHWPVLDAQALMFDDERYLFTNPVLMRPSGSHVRQVLGEVFTSSTVEGYYEPLTLITLMGDVAAGGNITNLYPFHRTSLLLHVACTLLLIVLIHALFRRRWLAAAVGLLFGLHPLTVEPVAWVWERKTLLATFFVLASLICYVRHARHRAPWAYLASLVLFVLALMSKPTVTPLPVLLLLLNIWPLRRLLAENESQEPLANRYFARGRSPFTARVLISPAVRESIPFFALAALSAGITIVSTARNAVLTVPGDFPAITVPLRISYVLFLYLAKMVWPCNLSPVYVLPEPITLARPVYLAALIGIIGLGLILLRWRRAPALVVGLLFFLFAMLPTLGIIRYSWVVAADKYVYFPVLGILLIAAWALLRLCGVTNEDIAPRPGAAVPTLRIESRVTRTRQRAVMGLVLVIAVAEGFATRSYLRLWRDTSTITRYMLELTPNVARLHANMGLLLIQQGRREEGLAHYRTALRLEPDCFDAHYNVGLEMLRQGQLTEAVRHLEAAIRAMPGDAEAHDNLGIALAEAGLIEDAAREFERAIQLRPESVKPYVNLATLRYKQDRLEEAVRYYRRALENDGRHALPHRNLALVLVRLNRIDEAIAAYQAALAVEPNANFACELGDLLARHGRINEARRAYVQALKITPSHARAQRRLASLPSG